MIIAFLSTLLLLPHERSGKQETTFALSGELDKSLWAMRFELRWHQNALKNRGGIEIDKWSLESSAAAVSQAELSGNLLNFPKVEVGATASYTSSAEYLVVVTSMSDIKSSWNGKGEFDFGGGAVEACGYHEVEAQFEAYYNKKREFDFVVTAVKEAQIGGIKAAGNVAVVGTGTVSIKIAKSTSGGIKYSAIAKLGGSIFGHRDVATKASVKTGKEEPVWGWKVKWIARSGPLLAL
ncbi:hypothetical protein R5W23_002581 [Gemmata sp. JC673]|uniref:Uncharacterized protein n=1 Tax=Gemmata algarum TaxID=2975278 RepID=A0ABU5F285_9BACT|nr:hypothetical protein [Gemmata algarum]MDY3561304.1 hypothetical protein [Gemmata algarum]